MDHQSPTSKRLIAPGVAEYSPLATAALFLLINGMALLGADLFVPLLSSMSMAYTLVLVFVVATLLQFGSRRLLWLRAFQLALSAGSIILLTWAAWSLYLEGLLTQYWAIFGVSLLVLFGATMRSGYREAESHDEPLSFGWFGLLNPRHGVLSVNRASDADVARYARSQTTSRQIQSWTPLIAGISMFLVNTLSLPGKHLMMLGVVILSAWMWAYMFGSTLFYYRKTEHWELSEGKHILVKW